MYHFQSLWLPRMKQKTIIIIIIIIIIIHACIIYFVLITLFSMFYCCHFKYSVLFVCLVALHLFVGKYLRWANVKKFTCQPTLNKASCILYVTHIV